MKIKLSKTLLIFIFFVLTGCNSTRTLYKSADSKKDFWKVNAFTLSHCGCTQLFVENYKGGRHDFQIMYTDNAARKYIYEYDERGKVVNTVVLVAKTDNVETPFDSLDTEIYRKLKTIADNKNALVYDIKWTDYTGYVKE